MYVCFIVYVIIRQPVGWCISDSETSGVIKVFLEAMKTQLTDTVINAIMTDDGIVIKTCIL